MDSSSFSLGFQLSRQLSCSGTGSLRLNINPWFIMFFERGDIEDHDLCWSFGDCGLLEKIRVASAT